jgi:TPR repeat protein
VRKAALALLVVAAGAIGFLAGERHATRDPLLLVPGAREPAAQGRAQASPSAVPETPLERVAAVPSALALPPINTPVAQVLDELERAAHAGDARAACRVAFELERCHELRALQASISTFRDLAERPGVGAELARRYNAIADRDQARFNEGRRLCEGVAPAEANEAWRYLLQAARAGHGPSMARFASRRAFSDADPVAALDGLIAFRNEGPSFLARAAQAGYPEAYEQLGFAYVTGIDLGLGVPHDAIRGIAYYTALMRVATPDEAARLQRAVDYAIQNDNVGAAEVARARAMADTLAAALLRRNVPGTVEIGKGPFAGDNGSHCER